MQHYSYSELTKLNLIISVVHTVFLVQMDVNCLGYHFIKELKKLVQIAFKTKRLAHKETLALNVKYNMYGVGLKNH